MNKILVSTFAAAAFAAFSHAAPVDDLKAAAKKLSDAPNYSWSTTTENAGGQGGFGGGATSGKAEKGGVSITTRETPNGGMQTLRKGDTIVMQNPQGGDWMTMDEMRAQFGGAGGPGGGAGGAPGGPGGQGGRAGGGGGFGMFGGGAAPADDVEALLTEVKELKAVDGVLVGDLNATAVGQRLAMGGGRGFGGGQAPAAPTNAMGSVKFWLKDGALAKYELHVKGTVEGRNGPRDTDRTTTTEIKDIGTTKIEVPEAAKKKLGA